MSSDDLCGRFPLKHERFELSVQISERCSMLVGSIVVERWNDGLTDCCDVCEFSKFRGYALKGPAAAKSELVEKSEGFYERLFFTQANRSNAINLTSWRKVFFSCFFQNVSTKERAKRTDHAHGVSGLQIVICVWAGLTENGVGHSFALSECGRCSVEPIELYRH